MLFELLEGMETSSRNLSASEYLFRRGDRAASLFTVRRGGVRVLRSTIDGREVVMGRARSGQTLCEAALTSPHYHCDAVASSSSVVGVVRKEKVLDAIRDDAEFAIAYAQALAHQLRHERARTETCSIRRARDRVLHFLERRADANGNVVVWTTLKDIASEVGLTHEAFYRELANLERDGFLERGSKHLRLVSRL